jgi:phytol kinase
MIIFTLCALYFLALFALIEIIARKAHLPIEVSRKLAHILAATSVAFLPYIVSFSAIIWLSVLCFCIMLASRYFHIFRSIHAVARTSYGELLFPVAIIVVALLFPQAHTFTYAVLVLALGDGLAGLIGSYFGRATYTIGESHKSYFGSTIFFIVTVLVTLIFNDQLSILLVAAALTLVEAGSTKGIDNLLLPPLAAWLLTVLK